MPTFTTLPLEVRDRIATITLNRPDRLNAIEDAMPGEIRAAVEAAGADDRVHVIVLQGAGKAFCTGYDLAFYAEGAGGGSSPRSSASSRRISSRSRAASSNSRSAAAPRMRFSRSAIAAFRSLPTKSEMPASLTGATVT